MNAILKTSAWILVCCAVNQAYAQQADSPASQTPAKPKATAQSEAGEPRADTSKTATAQSEAGEPRANTSRPATAPAKPATAQVKPATAASTAGQKAAGASDRLELGTATVTGDREQPKVMYIVPWKRSDIGDLAGKPMNSLVDEILAPVDRDVFKREVVYYKAVQSDTSQNGAPGHSSDQGEK
jgi:hypothetical protein